MRKFLYGTTALFVVGFATTMVATPVPKAMAAASAGTQPIQIQVGGFFQGFLVGASQSDATGEPGYQTRKVSIRPRSIIEFKGEAKFDNGIKAGVDLQLNGNNPTAPNSSGAQPVVAMTTYQDYLFLEYGNYGRMELGSTQSAAYKLWAGAATPIPGHGLNSPYFLEMGLGSNLAASPTTYISFPTVNDLGEKISYFTPRIAGFQLGISYTPSSCMSNGKSTADISGDYLNSCVFFGQMPSSNNAGVQSNIIETAVNYTGTFDGVSVTGYGGYGHSSLEAQANANNNLKDRDQFGLGGNVGYKNFTLGASFRTDNLGTRYGAPGNVAGTRQTDYDVGLSYGNGPYFAAITYHYTATNVENDAGVGLGHDTLSGVSLGGSYTLGPGVSMVGGVQYVDLKAHDSNPANQNRAWIYLVGTQLTF